MSSKSYFACLSILFSICVKFRTTGQRLPHPSSTIHRSLISTSNTSRPSEISDDFEVETLSNVQPQSGRQNPNVKPPLIQVLAHCRLLLQVQHCLWNVSTGSLTSETIYTSFVPIKPCIYLLAPVAPAFRQPRL